MCLATGKPREAFRGLRVREVARHCRHSLASHFLVDFKGLLDCPVNAEQTARTVNRALSHSRPKGVVSGEAFVVTGLRADRVISVQ